MTIVKLALIGFLRIAFFGSLKIALCAYTLFLSDTAFASAAREGNKVTKVGASAAQQAPIPNNRRSKS
jgi:hypothetical protein